MTSHTFSGLPSVGDLPWGAHFCHFYDNRDDLAEVLVPFFKAGLDQNEKCLWVTAEPFDAEGARAALRNSVPKLDALEKRGQIEIIDHHAGYLRNGADAPAEVRQAWLNREEDARSAGYRGLRLTGNTFWLEEHQWNEFTQYEETVNRGFRGRHVVALCSYCLSRCRGSDVLDVVRNHQFAVARRGGAWEIVESAELTIAKEELRKLNAELESRVTERTVELTHALADKDVLFQEVHHRVRNNLQVIQSILNLKARQIAYPEARESYVEAADQIRAIGLVHDLLYSQKRHADIDMGVYLRALVEALTASHGRGKEIAVAVEAHDATLDIAKATPVGLIANEVLVNALKHAFGDRPAG